jgi:hypothetical protein
MFRLDAKVIEVGAHAGGSASGPARRSLERSRHERIVEV